MVNEQDMADYLQQDSVEVLNVVGWIWWINSFWYFYDVDYGTGVCVHVFSPIPEIKNKLTPGPPGFVHVAK